MVEQRERSWAGLVVFCGKSFGLGNGGAERDLPGQGLASYFDVKSLGKHDHTNFHVSPTTGKHCTDHPRSSQ